jgi:PAS domain S-box-containing protein
MAKKPTYEELEQRVKELEPAAFKRKQVERALHEKLKHFTELWDDAPVAYHVLDTEGIIKEVNHTETDMLGYTKDEMVGKPIFDFVLPQQREEAEKRFRLKLAGDHIPKQDDRVYVKKDGSNIYVSIDDRLEFGSDGEVSGVRTTMVDISPQKKAEEALREGEEKYRNVVERSNDGIVIVQDGVIKYANPSLEIMSGYTADEAIDTPFTNYIYPNRLISIGGAWQASSYQQGMREGSGTRTAVG